jgi:UDP-N-acetylmuramate--alanine ligase
VAADGRALMRAIRVAGKIEPTFVDTADEIAAAVEDRVRDGDVVITMGAGSVGGVAPRLANVGGGE